MLRTVTATVRRLW